MIELYKLLSNLKWDIKFFSASLTNHEFKVFMEKNKSYINTHFGESCFVVGNGPSIKEENLSMLKDKFVFSVNDIYRNKEVYKALSSNVHTFIDPYYSQLSLEDFRKMIKEVKSDDETKLCLCTAEFIKYDCIFKENRIEPIYLYMHRNWLHKECRNLHLNRNIYSVQNVVQAPIMIALAMGFKKIYLMGCEMTSFYESLEYNANGILLQNHAHEVNETELNKVRKTRDNAFMLNDYAKTFLIFKALNKLADLYGAKIINLTRGGILDMFERENYNDVLNK